MTPTEFDQHVIAPGFALLPARLTSAPARALLIAIAGQESGWSARTQAGGGPAHSYFQCERAGGVAGCFSGAARPTLAAVCKTLDIAFNVDTIYAAIVWNDALACVLARLILWCDPAPLPAIPAREGEAWAYYERTWRPGKPDRTRWPGAYAAGIQVVSEARDAPYRDATFPERPCNHCGTPYRGPAVYCSHRCAVADDATELC
jgi:hypothetical protein